MMTDADEAKDQVERTERFIERLRDVIASTAVDPASLCADAQRRGLQRIADTLDAVPAGTMRDLACLDLMMRGLLLDLIKVRLMAVGAGPTLDVENATEFFAEFEGVVEQARRRRLQ